MTGRDIKAREDRDMGRKGRLVTSMGHSDGVGVVRMAIIDYPPPPSVERAAWQRRVVAWSCSEGGQWRQLYSAIGMQWYRVSP